MALTPIGIEDIEKVLARLVPDYKTRSGYTFADIEKKVPQQYNEMYAHKATNLSDKDKIEFTEENFLEKVKDSQIKKTALEFLFWDHLKEKKGVFLYGESGLGKTYLLKALCVKIAKFPNRITRFYRIREVLNYIDDELKMKNYDGRVPITETLSSPWALAIDDFGSERACGHRNLDKLDEILLKRFENNKRTFMTSILTPNEILGKYDKNFLRTLSKSMSFIELKGEPFLQEEEDDF